MDENVRDRFDEGERQKIIDELAKIQSFLRQQNPQAHLKAQIKKKIALDSLERSSSSSNLFLKHEPTQEPGPTSLQKQARELANSKRQLIEQGRRDDGVLSSVGDPQERRGDQSPSKFIELIKWMGDNFAEYPLLPAYRVQSTPHGKRPSPAVLIVTGDASSSSVARSFALNVADALSSRSIATSVISLSQWEELDEFNPTALKIIIAPNGAQDQLRQRVNEPPPLFLPIDWDECALNKGQKAELWETIKCHLRQEAR